MTARADSGSGCGTFIAGAIVLGLIVAGLISLAALIDPFSWLPPVGDIWAHCEDSYETARDDCALANRFPGFWVHALVNLTYVVVTAGLLLGLGLAIGELRTSRAARFSEIDAVERYARARQAVGILSALLAVAAALPIVVAVA